MLESPDYFFRVREIGGLRQTNQNPGCIERSKVRRGYSGRLQRCMVLIFTLLRTI